jgi:type III secretion low calcium response chaperone LcrH/SycD
MAQQAEQISEQDLQEIVQSVFESGSTLKAVRGLNDREMEAIYSVGFALYEQGKHSDAENIFRFLCFHDHLEKKYWMGLAATQQLLKKYAQAADTYSFCALLDVKDPVPPLHAGECYLAIGDLAKASSGFFAAVHWSGDQKQHAKTKARAEALLKIVEERRKSVEDTATTAR